MAWEDIVSDKEFQAQPFETKKSVAENYFSSKIATGDFLKQPKEVQDEVRSNFMKTVGAEPVDYYQEYVAKPVASSIAKVGRGGALVLGGLMANPENKDFFFNKVEELSDFIKTQEPSESVGKVGRFIRGIEELGIKLATGPMALPSFLLEAAGGGAEYVGIDPETAIALTTADIVATGAMARIPMGGKSFLGGAVRGAVANPAVGVAGDVVKKGILLAGGYKEQADQIKVTDIDRRLEEALMGVGFGLHQTLTLKLNAPKIAKAIESGDISASTYKANNFQKLYGEWGSEEFKKSFPSIAESVEPVEKSLMRERIRKDVSSVTGGKIKSRINEIVNSYSEEEKAKAALEKKPEEPRAEATQPTTAKPAATAEPKATAEENLTLNKMSPDDVPVYEVNESGQPGRLLGYRSAWSKEVKEKTLGDYRLEREMSKGADTLLKTPYGLGKIIDESDPSLVSIRLENGNVVQVGKDAAAKFEKVPSVVEPPIKPEESAAERLKRAGYTEQDELFKKVLSDPEAVARLQSTTTEQAEAAGLKGGAPSKEFPMPAPREVTSLRPAIQIGEEKFIGSEGDTHADVLSDFKQEDKGTRGFVDPFGRFLTRDEALDWVKKNQPEVASRVELKDGELHSENYWKAVQDVRTEAPEKPELAKPEELSNVLSNKGNFEALSAVETPEGVFVSRGGHAPLPKGEKTVTGFLIVGKGQLPIEASDQPIKVGPDKGRFVSLSDLDETNADVYKALKKRYGPSVSEDDKGIVLYANPITEGAKVILDLADKGLDKLNDTKLVDGMKSGFAAVLRKGAEGTAATLSEELSKSARGRDVFEHSTKEANKLMSYLAAEHPDIAIDFMQRMDTGQRQAHPTLQTVADTIERMFDQKVDEVRKLGTNSLLQVRENYFPHIWERKSVDAARKMLAKRPFEGPEGFRKQRKYDDVLSGIQAGLKPVSNNPLELVMLKMIEMDRYISANRTINAMKKSGDVKFFRSDVRPGEEWTKINDKFSTVWRPVKDAQGNVTGRAIAGHYYAKDAAATVLNNYLSESLYTKDKTGLFNAYMGVANELNQFQLGALSAYHAGFTSFETVVSQNALGIKQLSEGRVADAGKSFAKAPAAWILNPLRGDKLLKEWREPGSQSTEVADIIEALVSAGGRMNSLSGERFKTQHTKRMLKNWREGTALGKVKAAAESPFVAIEQSARPILEWLVPRQKFGVFGELMSDWMKENPNASHEEMRTAARQFWNRVDSRLGQVVYDRIFADNVAKNAVQALVRAPGWTGGTILEVGGGVIDTARALKAGLRGETPKVTDRMAYTAALILITAAINAALTYAFTGDTPKDKDFWAFRTGRKDKYGNDERFMLPTYAKDIKSYLNDPMGTLMHKTHPAIGVIGELKQNKESFTGNQIRDKDADYLVQLGQVGEYGVRQFVPFWVRGYQKASEQGITIAGIAAPLIGINPAPAAFTESEATQKLVALHRASREEGGRDKESQRKRNFIADIKRQYAEGSINVGDIMSMAAKENVSLSAKNRLEIAMMKAPAEEQDHLKMEYLLQGRDMHELVLSKNSVWSLMTQAEKSAYGPLILKRLPNSNNTLQDKEKVYDTIIGDLKKQVPAEKFD